MYMRIGRGYKCLYMKKVKSIWILSNENYEFSYSSTDFAKLTQQYCVIVFAIYVVVIYDAGVQCTRIHLV